MAKCHGCGENIKNRKAHVCDDMLIIAPDTTTPEYSNDDEEFERGHRVKNKRSFR